MKFIPYIFEPDKSIEVYEETEKFFNENTFLKKRIEELGWIYHTIGMIIPHNLDNYWSGHFFPFSESWDELQISFTQLCFGLYKQAFVSLRSGLELGMLSVYFNINDDGHNEVQGWLEANENKKYDTPRNSIIWNILLKNKNISKFNDKHDIKAIHENLGYLHNYVHTKGAKHSNSMGLCKSNFQTFESKLLYKWVDSYTDVITLVCTLHLLKYPIAVIPFDYRKKFGIDIPSFGGLEQYNIDKVTAILPESYFADIQQIAQEDPSTIETINEINSFPDMTEEQTEKQWIDLKKMFIKHGEGFTQWLKNYRTLLESFGEEEFDDLMQHRIEVLRVWAEENKFMESMDIRLDWGS